MVKWQRNINITNCPHAWVSQAWGKGQGESYTLFQTLPDDPFKPSLTMPKILYPCNSRYEIPSL